MRNVLGHLGAGHSPAIVMSGRTALLNVRQMSEADRLTVAAVVCAGIHMSDIPSFPYRMLWEERQLVSVANLTRKDGIDFLRLAPEIGIVTKTTAYSLARANDALADLRAGRFEGAAVLIP